MLHWLQQWIVLHCMFSFCSLTSGCLSALICFISSLLLHLFHHFFFARSRKDAREHSELCLVYMSLIGENVTSWSIKRTGFLFPQYDNCCFWKWPRGGCSVAVDDARSRKRTQYQNNTFKTGGGIHKQHKGAKITDVCFAVSRSNSFLNCLYEARDPQILKLAY